MKLCFLGISNKCWLPRRCVSLKSNRKEIKKKYTEKIYNNKMKMIENPRKGNK